MEITDNYIMESGKYAGQPIGEVPANYLLWLYDNNRANNKVKLYIAANLKHLQAEEME